MARLSQLLVAVSCLSEVLLVCAAKESDCPSPRIPYHAQIVWKSRVPELERSFPDGTVIGFECDPGYTLFGSKNATCLSGKWFGNDTKCYLEVAGGNRCHMSSQADEFVAAHLSADGDTRTCVSFGPNEKRLSWSVDTFQAFRIRAVKIVSRDALPNSSIEIRVGSHNPSTGSRFNELCTRQKVDGLEGNESQFLCENESAFGRYVSILIEEPGNQTVSLCEVNVFSDSGLSVRDGCPAESAIVPESARHIFENRCVQFLGQSSHENASLLCQAHGGSLVTPTSRHFQSFLDYHVVKFFETSMQQFIMSFWVNAKRVNGSGPWIDGDGDEIRGVQIDAGNDEDCLVSEVRSWHTAPCNRQHQVICVSEPLSCGNPPAYSSIGERSKLLVNHSTIVNCEPGSRANVNSITCFLNGTLSEEPWCTARSEMNFGLYSKISGFLRSFAFLAKLSAEALRAVIAAVAGLLAGLMSAIFTCCYCVCQRRKVKKFSDKFSSSLISFSVHMRDLPINTSNRTFTIPKEDEKQSPPKV